MPDVLATEGEAESLEAHRLVGHVAGEDDEVGPADLVAILLLDRPQQAAGLVEVAVVGPRVEGGEALVAGAAAAPAVGDAIGAGGVPGHADHQAAVVAPVGRPPGLAVGHQGLEVVLERVDVELLQLFAVVETGAHRVGLAVVLMKDVEVEGLGPPVHPGHAGRGQAAVHDRALAGRTRLVVICSHVFSPDGQGLTKQHFHRTGGVPQALIDCCHLFDSTPLCDRRCGGPRAALVVTAVTVRGSRGGDRAAARRGARGRPTAGSRSASRPAAARAGSGVRLP